MNCLKNEIKIPIQIHLANIFDIILSEMEEEEKEKLSISMTENELQ